MTTAPPSNSGDRPSSPPEAFELQEVDPLWINLAEQKGIVTEDIVPGCLGHVKYRGSRWRACSHCPYPLVAGTLVQIVGRKRSNVLVVEPT